MRQFAIHFLPPILALSRVLMCWQCLMLFTGCTTPLLVVCSRGGVNDYRVGTMILVTNIQGEKVMAGDSLVFHVPGQDMQVVHRVIKVQEDEKMGARFLTKGDDNPVDDRGLYPAGQVWLENKDVAGKVIFVMPYLGIVIIILQQNQLVGYALVVVFFLGNQGTFVNYYISIVGLSFLIQGVIR